MLFATLFSVFTVVLLTAVVLLGVLQYWSYTDRSQLKALVAEKDREIEALADKTLL